MLLLAALVLTASAWQRGAEYDEQYTLFLTAGTPRPDWPETVFPAGTVAAMQTGHASLAGIARDLRATDVHPPLYFWAVSIWRAVFGPSLFAVRMLSVLFGLVSLSLVGTIARRCAIPPVTPMLLTLGCYGFVYTNAIARGFAPAQMLTLCGVALLFGRRPLLAGACLGAACCCNYLAVFVAAAVVIAAGAWLAVPATIPFLAVAAWFFAAQHGARPGQFPPFAVVAEPAAVGGVPDRRGVRWVASVRRWRRPDRGGGDRRPGVDRPCALRRPSPAVARRPQRSGWFWPLRWPRRSDCCCWAPCSTTHRSNCATSRSDCRSSPCWSPGRCAGAIFDCHGRILSDWLAGIYQTGMAATYQTGMAGTYQRVMAGLGPATHDFGGTWTTRRG